MKCPLPKLCATLIQNSSLLRISNELWSIFTSQDLANIFNTAEVTTDAWLKKAVYYPPLVSLPYIMLIFFGAWWRVHMPRNCYESQRSSLWLCGPKVAPPLVGLVELGALSSHQPPRAFDRVWFDLFEGVELCVVLYLLARLVSPIIKRQNDQIRPLWEKVHLHRDVRSRTRLLNKYSFMHGIVRQVTCDQ